MALIMALIIMLAAHQVRCQPLRQRTWCQIGRCRMPGRSRSKPFSSWSPLVGLIVLSKFTWLLMSLFACVLACVLVWLVT